MLWGWLRSALLALPRDDDLVFRRFLRRYQLRALLVGKKQAIEEIDSTNHTHGTASRF